MSTVELERAPLQSTSWERVFGATSRWIVESSERPAISATVGLTYTAPSDVVTSRQLLNLSLTRLRKLLSVGAIRSDTANAALNVIASLVQDDSATPQISATEDRGVAVEWLVNRENLVAEITDQLNVAIWGIDADDVIQFEYELPARFFSTSPDKLRARLYLAQISAGVTNRVSA